MEEPGKAEGWGRGIRGRRNRKEAGGGRSDGQRQEVSVGSQREGERSAGMDGEQQ